MMLRFISLISLISYPPIIHKRGLKELYVAGATLSVLDVLNVNAPGIYAQTAISTTFPYQMLVNHDKNLVFITEGFLGTEVWDCSTITTPAKLGFVVSKWAYSIKASKDFSIYFVGDKGDGIKTYKLQTF